MNTTDMSPAKSALPRRLVIYLPSCSQNGQPIANFEEHVAAVSRKLCEWFGGATNYPATGNFTLENGSIQQEKIQVIECYCEDSAWTEKQEFVWNMATSLSRALNQESLACAVDGRMKFIRGTE